MNWRFVARGIALAVGAIGILLIALYLALPSLLLRIPYGPTPPAPEIAVPRGDPPSQWPGLEVWSVFPARDPQLAGSGFFLRLPDGVVVYVSAAHAFDFASDLQQIEVGPDPHILTHLYGDPGEARLFGSDLRVDFVFFAVADDLLPDTIAVPDDRGGPQAGERVALYPGVGQRNYPMMGTVLSVESKAAWVIMDDAFEAALMSGSPFFSAHTGRVVGMALVAGEQQGHTVIGMHPIESLVEKGLETRAILSIDGFGE
jgi:hypothetical protein